MNSCIVTLKVRLLLKSLLADAADVLRRFTALVVKMSLQASFVSVRSSTLVTWKWILMAGVVISSVSSR